jgi:hypothetical protein
VFEAEPFVTFSDNFEDGNLNGWDISPSPSPDQRRRLAPPLPHPGIASPPAGAAGIPGHIGRKSSWHC